MSLSAFTTCLWFDGQAEEAAEFYTSIFKNSKITCKQRYPEAGSEQHGREPGSTMAVEFELNGQQFYGLNGGPHFKFNEAVSFMIDCKDQAEVDYFWDKLVQGGKPRDCGWVQDRFGLCWQVVPRVLMEFNRSDDKAARERSFAAMLTMTKLDVAKLQRAFEG